MRPKRTKRDAPSDFQDPLKNYDGPDYADALERSIAEDSVAVMKITPFSSISSQTTVHDAMKLMAKNSIASLLVVNENGKLVGIFSERDVLNKIADRFEDLKDSPVTKVMTHEPMYVYVTDSPGKAMNLMATAGFRHVPILDVDDKVVGMLGPRRVTRFLQTHL
jgi:CBS domain-containing protein